jgi:hypothetical protein
MQEKGIYGVITIEEYIVVNEVVASPFAVNHYIVNKYYNIHRMLFNYAPFMMKSSLFSLINKVADVVAFVAFKFIYLIIIFIFAC